MKIVSSGFLCVIVYTINASRKKLISSVCEKLGVNLIEAQKKTDLLINEYRLAFIDKELLDEDLSIALNVIACKKKPRNWKVIFLGGSPDSIPDQLSFYCNGLTKPNFDIVSKIIEKHITKTPVVKVDVLAKRIHRIVYLYHLVNKNVTLNKHELCKAMGVTERTLFRDLKVLRELFPDQNFHIERDFHF